MGVPNDIDMETVQFLMTEDCNLDCVYCYEKHKAKKAISAEFIKEIIFRKMTEENGYNRLSVDFFGGEPLLAFNTIREVVDWFHGVHWPPSAKAYRFAITTNGMLLNKQRKAWFSRYRDAVTLCLSLDGTREAHNRNRNNSYDKVMKNIDFFRETWPHQPVKMTVSQYTLDQMYDGIVNIHNLGLSVEANVVFEDVWGSPEEKFEALRLYARELDKLVCFYHRNPKLRRPRVIDKNIMALYDRRHLGDDMFCGAGAQLNCWTADTTKYPCMRFAPISTSRPLEDLQQAPEAINLQCRECPFERLCPTCEGHNYEVNGSCHNRTSFHCDFFKVEMMAAAKLFFMENREEMLAKGVNGAAEEDNLVRLRKLLVVKSIMDYCEPVLAAPVELPPNAPPPVSAGAIPVRQASNFQ